MSRHAKTFPRSSVTRAATRFTKEAALAVTHGWCFFCPKGAKAKPLAAKRRISSRGICFKCACLAIVALGTNRRGGK